LNLRAVFSKDQEAKFISHLDLQRTLERALRRARIPVRYSQGYNPKPRFSVASALMLGAAGDNEIMDIHLDRPVEPGQFVDRMNGSLTPGIRFRAARALPEGAKDAASLVKAARYRITFGDRELPLGELVSRFVSSDTVMVQKHTKEGTKTVNARPVVLEMASRSSAEVDVLLDVSVPTVKPSEIAGALLASAGMVNDVLFECRRTELLGTSRGRLVPLFDTEV
jgi:radical SAM-linked protein